MNGLTHSCSQQERQLDNFGEIFQIAGIMFVGDIFTKTLPTTHIQIFSKNHFRCLQKFKFMLEIDIFRNSSQHKLGVLRGDF